MEELFSQYLKENFSPELDKGQLGKVKQDLRDLWEPKEKDKIKAFKIYDQLRKIKAEDRTDEQNTEMSRLTLTKEEKECESWIDFQALLAAEKERFKDVNWNNFVQGAKDEILYEKHFDPDANRWKLE
ncbi:hypothetical protein EBX93_10990 [bacterium]|nr:hypothetical protein [bacterium]